MRGVKGLSGRAADGREKVVSLGALAIVCAALACTSASVGRPDHAHGGLPGPVAVASCDERGPGPSLPAAALDSFPASDDDRSSDAQLARFAREVPGGFAGYYLERPSGAPLRDGAPRQRGVVRLVDPSQREAAVQALTPRMAAMYRGHSLDLSDAVILPARWDFAQLYDWYSYLSPHVWSVHGVQSSDIDETGNRIVFGVMGNDTRRLLEERFATLRVPCGLVHVAVSPADIPVTGIPTSAPTFRGRVVKADTVHVLIQDQPAGRTTGQVLVGVPATARIFRLGGGPATRADIGVGRTVRVWVVGPILLSDPAKASAEVIVIE